MQRFQKALEKGNLYKTLNVDGTGFDNRNRKIEANCTLVAVVCIFVAIVFSAFYYGLTKRVHAHQELTPSLARYLEIQDETRDSLIGKIVCPCTYSVLPHGTYCDDGSDCGGFVNEAKYSLDTMCQWKDEQTKAPDGPAMIKGFVKMNVSASLPGQPGPAQYKELWGCANISSLNPGLSWSVSTTPWAECAVVHYLAQAVLLEMNRLCAVADNIVEKSLEGWMLDSFVTTHLFSKALLQELVIADLDRLASADGHLMAAGNLFSMATDVDKQAHLLQVVTGSTIDPPDQYEVPCSNFYLGTDGMNGTLRSALLECASPPGARPPQYPKTGGNATFSGQCCNATTKICDTPRRLPCSAGMVELGIRLRESAYESIVDGIGSAFMLGMGNADRRARKEALGMKPVLNRLTKQGGRRLSAEGGGYVLSDDDTADSMFRRYYPGCNPSECAYTIYEKPDAQALILIVSGLTGGFIAAGKAAGLSLLLLAKAWKSFKGKDKVLPDESSEGRKVDQYAAGYVQDIMT